VTGCGDSRSMRLASPGRAQDATAVGKDGDGAVGRGQWAAAAGTRERNESRLRRERARRWGSRAGSGVGGRFPHSGPRPDLAHQPAHSTQHTGRRSWGVALQPHPRGGEEGRRGGEESNGITSAVVWWALNGREMVTVVVDSQLLHWACLHKLAHA
jgi:hypothetical protein